MPLSTINYGSGQDSMQDVFDKVNLAIDEINKINNNSVLKWKIIEIGDWDMTEDVSILIDIGVSHTKIRSIDAVIRNDVGVIYKLDYNNSGGVVLSYDGQLGLMASSSFDDPDFSATSYNRGWVTIGYVE